MNLKQRIAYYLGGFAIGLVLLFFFLSGKRTSCAYGPEARVLKNINLKDRVIDEEVLVILKSKGLDTSHLSTLLKKGDVIFSESNTSLDSCKLYVIKGKVEEQEVKLSVENCEKTATVYQIE